MSGEKKEAFIRRSVEVFDCDPTTVEIYDSFGAPQLTHPTPEGHLYLVVGAITSPDVRGVATLMNSLVTVTEGRDDVTLNAVLLENGRHDAASRAELTHAVTAASGKGPPGWINTEFKLPRNPSQMLDTKHGYCFATTIRHRRTLR